LLFRVGTKNIGRLQQGKGVCFFANSPNYRQKLRLSP